MADDANSGVQPSQLDQKLSRTSSLTSIFKEATGGLRIVGKKSPDQMPGITQQATSEVDRLTQTEQNVNTAILRMPSVNLPKYADKLARGGGIDFSSLLRSNGREFARLESIARKTVRSAGSDEPTRNVLRSVTDSDRLDRIAKDIRESRKLSDVMGIMAASSTMGSLQFQRTMSAGYMRKSLALSYQQVGLGKAMLSVTSSMADMLEAKLEAIKLNTAAPETAKASLWDRLKAEIRGQLVKERATKIINFGRRNFNNYIKDPASRQLYRVRSGQDFTNTLDISKDATVRTMDKFSAGMRKMGGSDKPVGERGFITNLFNQAGDKIAALSKQLKDAELSPDQKLNINSRARAIFSRIPFFYKKYTGEDAINSNDPPRDSLSNPIGANTDFAVLTVLKDIKSILLDWPKCNCDGSPFNHPDYQPFKGNKDTFGPKQKPKIRVRADIGNEVPSPDETPDTTVPPLQDSPKSEASRHSRIQEFRDRIAARKAEADARKSRNTIEDKSSPSPLEESLANAKAKVKATSTDLYNRGRAGASMAREGTVDGVRGEYDEDLTNRSRIYRATNEGTYTVLNPRIAYRRGMAAFWNKVNEADAEDQAAAKVKEVTGESDTSPMSTGGWIRGIGNSLRHPFRFSAALRRHLNADDETPQPETPETSVPPLQDSPNTETARHSRIQALRDRIAARTAETDARRSRNTTQSNSTPSFVQPLNANPSHPTESERAMQAARYAMGAEHREQRVGERLATVGNDVEKSDTPNTVNRAESLIDRIVPKRDKPTSTPRRGLFGRLFGRRTETPSSLHNPIPPTPDMEHTPLHDQRVRDTVLNFNRVVAQRHVDSLAKEFGISAEDMVHDLHDQGIDVVSDKHIEDLNPTRRKELLMQSRIFTRDVMGSIFRRRMGQDEAHPLLASIRRNGGLRNILRQKFFSLSDIDPSLYKQHYNENNLPPWPEADPDGFWAKTRTRRFFRAIGRGAKYGARDIGLLYGPEITSLPTKVAGPGYFADIVKSHFKAGIEKQREKVEQIRKNDKLLGKASNRMITVPMEGAGEAAGVLLKGSFKLLKATNDLLSGKKPTKDKVEKRVGLEEKLTGKVRPNSLSDYLRRIDDGHNAALGYLLDKIAFPLLKGAGNGVVKAGKLGYDSALKASIPVQGAWDGTKSLLEDMFGGTLLGFAGKHLWRAGTLPFRIGGTALKLGGAGIGAAAKGLYRGVGGSSLMSKLASASKFGISHGLGLDDIAAGFIGEKLRDIGNKSHNKWTHRILGYGGAALQYGAVGMALGGPAGAAAFAALGLLSERLGGLGNVVHAATGVLGQGAHLVGLGMSSVFHGLVGRKARVTRDGKVISKGHDGIIGETLGYLFGSDTRRTRTGQVYQDGHTGLFPAIWQFFAGKSYSNGQHIDGSSTFMNGVRKVAGFFNPIARANAMSPDYHYTPMGHNGKYGSANANANEQSNPGKSGPNALLNTKGIIPGTVVGGQEANPSSATFGWEKVTGQLNDHASPYAKFLNIRLEMYGITDRSVTDYLVSLEKAQEGVFNSAWGKTKGDDKVTSFNMDDYAYMAKRFGFDENNPDAVAYFESWYQRRFRPVCKAAMLAFKSDKMTFEGLYKVKDEQVSKYVTSMKQMLTNVLNETAGLKPDVATYLKYKKVADADPGGATAQQIKPTKAFNPFKDDQATKLDTDAKNPTDVDKNTGLPKVDKQSSVLPPVLSKDELNSDGVVHAALATGDVTDQPEYKMAYAKLPGDIQKRVQASRALQFVLWSTAVQSGPSVAVEMFKKQFVSTEDNRTFIRKIYEDRSTKFINAKTSDRIAAMGHIGSEEDFAQGMEDGTTHSFADMADEAGVAIRPMGDATIPDTGTPTPAKQKALAKQAYDFFIKKGYTPAAAAGIIASIRQESGFDPHRPGDSGAAYGLAQWHRDRQEDIANHFGKPIQAMSFEEQLAAIDWEMRSGSDPQAREAFKRLQGIKDPNAAGQIVSRLYERPGQTDAIRTQEALHRGANAAAMFADLQKPDTGTPDGSKTQVASANGMDQSGGTVVPPTSTKTADGSLASIGGSVIPAAFQAPSPTPQSNSPETADATPSVLPPTSGQSAQSQTPSPTTVSPAKPTAPASAFPVMTPPPKGGHTSQETLLGIHSLLKQQNDYLSEMLKQHGTSTDALSKIAQNTDASKNGQASNSQSPSGNATFAPSIHITPQKNRDSSVNFSKKASLTGDTV